MRDTDWAPPYVSLEQSRERAEAAALAWAAEAFGPGSYRTVGGEFVGKAQDQRWGEHL